MILPTQFREGGFDFTTWRCTPESGHVLDDVLKPEYWSHVSGRIKPGDIIQVVAEDLSYFVELFVIDAQKGGAKCKPIRKVMFTAEEAAPLESGDAYEIVFRGPKRFSVKRKGDGMILSELHPTRDDAAAWLVNHSKQMAA